jgi:hypothetical protein
MDAQRALAEETRPPATRSVSEVLYGSQRDGWSPPAPHQYQRVTIGDDPHSVVHAAPERALSVAEQISNMIARQHG